nr:hypothetical protein [Lachnospiraceae bacterium]
KKEEEKHDAKPQSKAAVLIPAAVLLVMGVLPNVVMKNIARFGVLSEATGLKQLGDVAYFSLENLKGGGISIIIGILLFILFVRRSKPLPKWVDLELYVYTPLMLHILPFIFGFVSRCLDRITDMFTLFMRKKVLNAKKRAEIGTETTLKYRLSKLLEIGGREATEAEKLLGTGLSYSLLLFSIGLIVVLCYMFF